MLVRRCPPVAQWADSRLQLPEGSAAPLDGATSRRAKIQPFPSPRVQQFVAAERVIVAEV